MAAESEIQDFLTKVGAAAEVAYNAAMQGGELQAAWRQGLGELGNALVAFPNGIHHEEPGTVFSPLHSDIAQGLETYRPSPADLGGGQEPKQQADTPQVSPADLTESNAPAAQQQDQQQTQSRGISM